MKSLVYANDTVMVVELDEIVPSSLGEDQVLCRTKHVQLDSTDRQMINGKFAVDKIQGINILPFGGVVLGRLAIAEVIAIGSEVEDFEVGDLVCPDYKHPLDGQGFAREQFALPASRLIKQKPLPEGVAPRDPYRFGALVPMAERLMSTHMIGAGLATERHGIQRVKRETAFFVPGGSRSGHDAVIDSRLTRWELNNALLIGEGTELLFAAGIISSLPKGSGKENDLANVDVIMSSEDSQIKQLLEEIGVSVWDNSVNVFGAYDCLHFIGGFDKDLAEKIWEKMSPYGFIAVTQPAFGQETNEDYAPFTTNEKKSFFEGTESKRDYLGFGAGIITIMEKQHPRWWKETPVAEFDFAAVSKDDVCKAVKNPWNRVCFKF